MSNERLLGEIEDFMRAEVARQLSLHTADPGPAPSLAPSFRQVLQEQLSEAIESPCAARLAPATLSYTEYILCAPPHHYPTRDPGIHPTIARSGTLVVYLSGGSGIAMVA
ncbi:hypothetical protein HPB50_006995 [Hyalomma asiaticum]|uniref:Uncharacterized protein n=1 Tax=Hyalomma asiaticum TaxID=266040 RepID=A0ACB7SNI4_HYAAI|nr:hypothetical protein HPB50_006995 [Hyalomma asiaticum]